MMASLTTIYKPKFVVVEAEFDTILENQLRPERCKHVECGYVDGVQVCPHCHTTDFGWSYDRFAVCSKCKDFFLPPRGTQKKDLGKCCGRKMDLKYGTKCKQCGKYFGVTRTMGGSGKVECKNRNRFRTIDPAKLSSPNYKPTHASIRVKLWERDQGLGTAFLIADLRKNVFIEGKYNSNGSSIYKTEDLDPTEIICDEDLIQLMWEKGM
jgi:hypothetical protein